MMMHGVVMVWKSSDKGKSDCEIMEERWCGDELMMGGVMCED